VLVQVHIEDQPEKFPKDQRTIDWIGSLMESYAASWHIQWLKGTLNGTHPKSMTGYVNALKLRFEDRDAKDEVYASLDELRYEGCIRDMFTKIQTYNDKAMVSGAALNTLILVRLPQKILEQMHVVDPTGKTDNEIITIITNAGRTAEKWEAARKNLGLKASFRTSGKSKQSKYERSKEDEPEQKYKDRFRKSKTDKKDRFKVKKNRSEKDYNKTEGIDPMELSRRKAAGECLRCAWPVDRRGTHKVKDCQTPIKLDNGTASIPKANDYRKMKIAGVELSNGESDSENSEDSESSDSSEDSESSEGECLDESEKELEPELQEEGNWWDSPEGSD